MSKANRIALANLKGGCGKSTLALNLAGGLSRRGSVSLLDADPQGALRHWSSWALTDKQAGLTVSQADAPADIRLAASCSDFVVVDCPPSLDMAVTEPLLHEVGHIIIPVLPSPLDLWATHAVVETVERVRASNPELRAWLLLNQQEQGSALSRAMAQVLDQLQLPIMSTQVRRRAAYRLAMLEGKNVYQLGARGRLAVQEIENVIAEVFAS